MKKQKDKFQLTVMKESAVISVLDQLKENFNLKKDLRMVELSTSGSKIVMTISPQSKVKVCDERSTFLVEVILFFFIYFILIILIIF